MQPVAFLPLAAILLLVMPGPAQGHPLGRSILFIRGADGTGGLGQGTKQQRTENLSDINNLSQAPGNHGFGELAKALRQDGFSVSQWIESQGALSAALLRGHRIVVFGSNNRSYQAAEVAAFHAWFDAGGSALFISDANWGPNWSAAPRSDNQFLARYGLHVYQDSAAGIPVMARSQPGRFLAPSHAVLSGPGGTGGTDDVNTYDGEGVSFFAVQPRSTFAPRRLVSAKGFSVRLITANGTPGGTRPAGPNDTAMPIVVRGAGAILGHFDRNSFFNRNGAGSELARRDNRRLALHIFRFLAAGPAKVTPRGRGCGLNGRMPALGAGPPQLGRTLRFTLKNAAPNAAGSLLLSPGAAKPLRLPGGCVLFANALSLLAIPAPRTDRSGAWVRSLLLPSSHTLGGAVLTTQALILAPGGPVLGLAELSSALELRLGFAR